MCSGVFWLAKCERAGFGTTQASPDISDTTGLTAELTLTSPTMSSSSPLVVSVLNEIKADAAVDAGLQYHVIYNHTGMPAFFVFFFAPFILPHLSPFPPAHAPSLCISFALARVLVVWHRMVDSIHKCGAEGECRSATISKGG